jgi:hypothetical protein
MSRSLTLSTLDIINAAKALKLLRQGTDAPTPGVPAPPFGAVLRVGSALRALLHVVQEFDRQQVAVQAQYALKDGDDYVLARDANGNILNGAFYIGQAPAFNQRMAEMQAEEHPIELGDLSMDDVLDVGQTRIGVDTISDLLPILSSTEPSADALARFEALRAQSAPAPKPAASVPQTDGGA